MSLHPCTGWQPADYSLYRHPLGRGEFPDVTGLLAGGIIDSASILPLINTEGISIWGTGNTCLCANKKMVMSRRMVFAADARGGVGADRYSPIYSTPFVSRTAAVWGPHGSNSFKWSSGTALQAICPKFALVWAGHVTKMAEISDQNWP